MTRFSHLLFLFIWTRVVSYDSHAGRSFTHRALCSKQVIRFIRSFLSILTLRFPSGRQLLLGSRSTKMDDIPNPGKYKIALLVMFTAGLITTVAVMGMAMGPAKAAATETSPVIELLIAPRVIPDCIPNYGDCMDMQVYKPCCRQQQLEVGQVIPEDFVCFRFGEGLCQPLSSIGRLDKYAQLIKFANVNNVIELMDQYYQDEIPEEPTTGSGLDEVPIERADGLTYPDGFTTEPDAVLIEPAGAPVELKDVVEL
ncbi:Cys1 [Hyposoter didymator ichnovirus]|nr:Cys1 [Hyposoter didymator ichnovirus]